MREFVPAWKRARIAEQEARRNAPPVAAHVLGAIVNALGELPTETQKMHYLALLVEDGKLTPAQADYVAKCAAGVLL